MHYAGATTMETFRRLAVEHLSSSGRHVIVNYSRTALQQDGPGHISPLGAYDADSDRFLILDVSRYKAPAVWVPTAALFAAMAEPLGPDNPRTRGFVLIRAPGGGKDGRTPPASPPT
jgi:glutathione-S-conjugate glycine hydrolase